MGAASAELTAPTHDHCPACFVSVDDASPSFPYCTAACEAVHIVRRAAWRFRLAALRTAMVQLAHFRYRKRDYRDCR